MILNKSSFKLQYLWPLPLFLVCILLLDSFLLAPSRTVETVKSGFIESSTGSGYGLYYSYNLSAEGRKQITYSKYWHIEYVFLQAFTLEEHFVE